MSITKQFMYAYEEIKSKKSLREVTILDAIDNESQLSALTDTLSKTIITPEDYENDNVPDEVTIESAVKAMVYADKANTTELYSKLPRKEDDDVTEYNLNFGLIQTVKDKVTIEHFDGKRPDLVQTATFIYNIHASKQNEAEEALFPTVIGDVLSGGYKITIRIPYTQTDFLRTNTKPDEPKFNRKSLIKEINNPQEIFGKDFLKLLPVLNDRYKDVLDEDFQQSNVYYDASDELIDTAPFKLNIVIPVMAVSQTDTLIAKGLLDQTDTLDRNIKVPAVYFKVGDDKIKLNTSRLPGMKFVPSQEGDDRDMILNSVVDNYVVDLKSLTQYDGSETTEFDDVPAGFKAVFSYTAFGRTNLSTGDTELSINRWQFVGVRDEQGQEVAEGEEGYSDTKDAAEKFTPSSYDLDIRIINSNLRRNGIMVTAIKKSQIEYIKARSPLYVEAPLPNSNIGETDASFMNELVSLTGAISSMNAILTLVDFADYMKSVTAGNIAPEEITTATIGGYIINPYFKQQTLSVTEYLDSRRSGEKRDDIQAVFIDTIRTSVMTMLDSSRYLNLIQYLGNIKTDIVLVTDKLIASYLPDSFSISRGITCKVYTSTNIYLQGKMYVTLGDFSPNRKSINIYRFGSHLYTPAIVTEGTKSVNGAVKNVFSVTPIINHIITMPLLLEFDVPDLDAGLRKTAVNVNNLS